MELVKYVTNLVKNVLEANITSVLIVCLVIFYIKDSVCLKTVLLDNINKEINVLMSVILEISLMLPPLYVLLVTNLVKNVAGLQLIIALIVGLISP